MSDKEMECASAVAEKSSSSSSYSSPRHGETVGVDAATAPRSDEVVVGIEVCQGPDCYGAGGGATLLEMEELCQEYRWYDDHNNNDNDDNNQEHHHAVIKPVIRRGGCRNHCSMGPNVYIRGNHFTKIKTSQDCVHLMDQNFAAAASHKNTDDQHVTSDYNNNNNNNNNNNSVVTASPVPSCGVNGMVLRRKRQYLERKKWNFLRNLSSAQKSRDRNRVRSLRRELVEHTELERALVVVDETTTNGEKIDAWSERILRRQQRYGQFITDITIQDEDNTFTKTSSDIDDDDDDDDDDSISSDQHGKG